MHRDPSVPLTDRSHVAGRHLPSEVLPRLIAHAAVVSGELQSVVDFRCGLDADVQVPRKFLPCGGATAFNNVTGDGICSPDELGFSIGPATLGKGERRLHCRERDLVRIAKRAIDGSLARFIVLGLRQHCVIGDLRRSSFRRMGRTVHRDRSRTNRDASHQSWPVIGRPFVAIRFPSSVKCSRRLSKVRETAQRMTDHQRPMTQCE